MSDRILFWHRKDLRISDNIGLAAACQQSSKIVGVFCFDPNICDRNDIAPARIQYLIGCLQELQANYLQAGSQLLILQGEPSRCRGHCHAGVGPLRTGQAGSEQWDARLAGKTHDRNRGAKRGTHRTCGPKGAQIAGRSYICLHRSGS